CTSDTIDLLSAEEERLFYRLLINADDFGRFDGRATVVLAACFPLRLHEISVDEVESWLQQLADVDLIRFYDTDGRRYLHFVTWNKHQRMRAKHRKYPAPPTKVDAKAVGDDTPSTNGDAPTRHDGDASPHGEHMTDTCPSRDGQAPGARRPRNEKREYEKREARNETRAPEGDVGASIDSDSLLSPSEDLQKVVEHYHQVIGLLSPVAFQKLQFWLDEQGMEADVVCAAI